MIVVLLSTNSATLDHLDNTCKHIDPHPGFILLNWHKLFLHSTLLILIFRGLIVINWFWLSHHGFFNQIDMITYSLIRESFIISQSNWLSYGPSWFSHFMSLWWPSFLIIVVLIWLVLSFSCIGLLCPFN